MIWCARACRALLRRSAGAARDESSLRQMLAAEVLHDIQQDVWPPGDLASGETGRVVSQHRKLVRGLSQTCPASRPTHAVGPQRDCLDGWPCGQPTCLRDEHRSGRLTQQRCSLWSSIRSCPELAAHISGCPWCAGGARLTLKRCGRSSNRVGCGFESTLGVPHECYFSSL